MGVRCCLRVLDPRDLAEVQRARTRSGAATPPVFLEARACSEATSGGSQAISKPSPLFRSQLMSRDEEVQVESERTAGILL